MNLGPAKKLIFVEPRLDSCKCDTCRLYDNPPIYEPAELFVDPEAAKRSLRARGGSWLIPKNEKSILSWAVREPPKSAPVRFHYECIPIGSFNME